MEFRIADVAVHYLEHGAGVPLVALHGAGVDHREIEAAIEAVLTGVGYRRVYPDLPGMGRSTTGSLTCNNDVVMLLGELIDRLGAGPAMVLGHSYGAYLARGVAAQRPELVRGLALLCPVGGRSARAPDHVVVRQDPDAYFELAPGLREGFDAYFVVRTRETARRYSDQIAPGKALVDEAALGRIFAGWEVDVGSATFSAPTLIVAGRRDSIAGYHEAKDLLERYPGATLAVIDGAGHALMHEQPKLLTALLGHWLDRTQSKSVSHPAPSSSA